MGNSRINFVFAFVLALIGTLALSGVLYGCVDDDVTAGEGDVTLDAVGGSAKNVFGAVVPHHLLVAKDIDLFYEKLAVAGTAPFEHIVLISPNHFAYGSSYVQTTNVFSGYDVRLNLHLINLLNGYGAARIEPTFFNREHGIFAHFDFINKYFPEADVTPIIVKRDSTKEKLDILAQVLKNEVPDNTLIIASVDFTHFEAEEFARIDDDRTIAWLESWSRRDEGDKHVSNDFEEIRALAIATSQFKSDVPDTDPVAIDSPESLYVMTRIFDNFDFEKRTSSALILKTTKPEANTTHIFGLLTFSPIER